MKWLAIGLGLLLVGEVVDVVIVPPAPWWSGVTVAGILAILAAVTVSITTIITALNTGETKRAVEAVAAVNVAQTTKLTEIKALVDGPVAKQLRQIADLLEDKAQGSGLVADRARADDARKTSDDKDALAASVADSGARDRRVGDEQAR